MLEID